MTRKGAQVGPSLEWTGVMSQDIVNCERFLFLFCTQVGWVQKVHGGWETGGGVILNKKHK